MAWSSKRTWANSPSTATPITAAALNSLEDGVEEGVTAVRGRLSDVTLSATFAPVRTVDMLTAGAVADGATDDWSVYVAARTAAGAKGTVHFPARSGASVTTYYLAGARPDLSGTNITADPGVVLKFADENPNTKALDLRSPVTIENVAQGITRAKPSNRDKSDMAAFAVAGGAQYEPLALTAVDFTSGWSVGEFTGSPTWGNSGTFTGTVASSKLSWASAFGSNAQGVHAPCLVGNAYEFTFETTEDTTGAGYVGVMIGSNAIQALSVEWRFNVDSATIDRYLTGVSDTTITVPTNNGKSYQLALQPAPGLPSAIVVRVLIVSATIAEVYVNGLLVDRYTTAYSISRIGAFVSPTASAKASIERGIIYTASHPVKHKHAKVLVIGDSQSYGAWSSLAIEDLLPPALASVTGGGSVDVTNISVSGTSAQAWVDAGVVAVPVTHDPIDVSGYDYVLINLGTNNVQGGLGQGTFATAIGSLTTNIRSQGSEPIYGLFPSFAGPAVGSGGVTTVYPDQVAAYRTILTYHCALNGVQMADVNEHFGNGIALYLDRIHPAVLGQALLARAYAQAIARKRAGADDRRSITGDGPWTTIPSGWYSNSWVSGPSAAGQYRQRANGDIELRGRINGGTAGSSAAITFPANFKPLIAAAFNGRALNAGVESVATIALSTAGVLTVNVGSTGTGSTTFTQLDACHWSTN